MSSQGNPTPVLEEQELKTDLPPMFKVYLLNDDFTPMEFVVIVLQKFFGKGREQATQIMLKVHREGRGVCGVYPKDIASTKVDLVSSFARQHQHPLQCVMEET
ncbi:MAG: ATP-dependent Clp protease adapter ClpS [Limnobacter sp.]|nr:ATP-dependent Clp protease adapter ClpS [Limnobacter sp.]